jgi:SAM-dependent methyltransferase
MRFAARLARGARVLDLACGTGRHARALAAQGCDVDAVDRDPLCAQTLQGVAGVRFRCLDLESDLWPIAADGYDAVIVANYLYRPRLAQLAQALRDGGLLLYETFAAGQESLGRPGNPDYLLQPFELARVFAPLLHVLAFEDGVVHGDRHARVQRLCGVRTGASRLDRLALPPDV